MLSLLKHMALILVAIIIWNCDSRIAKINMPASIYATFSDGSGYFKPKDNPPYRDSINFQIPSFYPKGSSHHTKIDSMLLKAPAPIKVHSATSEDTIFDLNDVNGINIIDSEGKSTIHFVVGEIILSNKAEIIEFMIPEIKSLGIIDDDFVIELSDEFLVPDQYYIPEIEISPGASISPDPSQPMNFSKDVSYTVTAEDGTENNYTVKRTNDRYGKIDITDLVLIYHGGVHRPMEWYKHEFDPYVVYENEGQKDWLFDAFLFLEFKDGKERGYAPGYVEKNARKEEWIWLMDRHFDKRIAFSALEENIKDQIREIGEPPFKHKVIMGLPSPISGQEDWGEIDGVELDFNNLEDRLTAGKWFIDQFIERFDDNDYHHIELAGFYWVDEDTQMNEDLLPLLGDYIREKDLRFFWIPYWNAKGNIFWKDLGFDFAWQQPNHFFNDEIPDSRLDDACKLAREHGMGMELEFDGRAMNTSSNNFGYRLHSYIDKFEKHGVFTNSSVAYYEGGNGLYHLSRSNDPTDKELYDKLARVIVDRKDIFFNGQ